MPQFLSSVFYKNFAQNLIPKFVQFVYCISLANALYYNQEVRQWWNVSRASADLIKPTGIRNKHPLPSQKKQKRGNKNDYSYNYSYLFNNGSCDEFY